jgi:hypothetical protein
MTVECLLSCSIIGNGRAISGLAALALKRYWSAFAFYLVFVNFRRFLLRRNDGGGALFLQPCLLSRECFVTSLLSE